MYRVSRENPGQFQIVDNIVSGDDTIAAAMVTITPIFGSTPGLITLAAEELEGATISYDDTLLGGGAT